MPALALVLAALLAVPAGATSPPPPGGSIKPVLPSLADTKVTLAWEDFKRLVEATFEDERPVPQPPAAYAIDRVSYQAEVRKGAMMVKAQLTVTVLEPEAWVTIPLVGGCSVTDVRGVKDALVVEGDTYQLLARGAGARTFEMDFVVKGGDRPGQNVVSFRSPEAAVSYARVVASAEVEKVEAPELPGAVTEQDGKAVLGALPRGGFLSVTYYLPLPKEATAAGVQEVKQDPKVFVEEHTLATVGEGLLRLRTTFVYDVLHAPVTTFRYRVPDGVEVLQATGTDLQEGFKILKEADGSRTLEVRATFEVKGAYQVAVTSEKDLGAEKAVTADLTLLEPLSVERASGVVGIEAEANAEVEPVALEHLTAVDVTEVPQDVWDAAGNPLLLGFRYLERPFKGSLRITRHDDLDVMVAACDAAFVTTLVTDDGATLTRALFNLRNNRRQFLRVFLPEGAEVWSVFIRDRAVKPARGKEGDAPSVLVPLPRSIDGRQGGAAAAPEQAFPLEVVYFQQAASVSRLGGSLRVQAPAIDVPVSQMGLSLYLPVRRSYSFLSGALRPEADFHAAPGMGDLLGGFADKAVMLRSYEPAATAPAAPPAPDAGAAPSDDFAQKQVEEDGRFKEKVQKKAYAASTAAGSLPVRITFPEEGVNLRFRKLLAIGDPESVRLLYVHRSVTWLLEMLLRLAGIATGIALVRLAARATREGLAALRPGPGRPETAVVAASAAYAILGAALLHLDASLVTFWAILVGLPFAVATLAAGAAGRLRSWRRGGGPPPTPPAPPSPPAGTSTDANGAPSSEDPAPAAA